MLSELENSELGLFLLCKETKPQITEGLHGCPLGTGVLKPETPKGVQFDFDV